MLHSSPRPRSAVACPARRGYATGMTTPPADGSLPSCSINTAVVIGLMIYSMVKGDTNWRYGATS